MKSPQKVAASGGGSGAGSGGGAGRRRRRGLTGSSTYKNDWTFVDDIRRVKRSTDPNEHCARGIIQVLTPQFMSSTGNGRPDLLRD